MLPRTWFYQGIIGGWAAGIGYLVGLALRWAYRRYLHRLHPLANPDNWPPRVIAVGRPLGVGHGVVVAPLAGHAR